MKSDKLSINERLKSLTEFKASLNGKETGYLKFKDLSVLNFDVDSNEFMYERFGKDISKLVSPSTKSSLSGADGGHVIDSEKIARNVVQVVPRIRSNISFEAEEKFEGIIDTITEKTFSAKLVSILNPDAQTEEYAEFDIDEIVESDKELAKPGSIFYWYIGKSTDSSGRTRRTSEIRFRRLPVWSESDFRNAEKFNEELSELFENSNTSKRA
jgi:hypothetical protein